MAVSRFARPARVASGKVRYPWRKSSSALSYNGFDRVRQGRSRSSDVCDQGHRRRGGQDTQDHRGRALARRLLALHVHVEHIPDTTDRLDQLGPSRVYLELAAEAADLDVDAAVERPGFAAAHVLEDLVSG